MLKINSAIMDLFYPVGTYYETSNVDFDPNVAWGGTWVLDSQGRVTVSQDTSDTDFDTLGETGGEKEHKLKLDEMAVSPFQASGGTGTWNYLGIGPAQPHNNLQPYVVVKRWHRTA